MDEHRSYIASDECAYDRDLKGVTEVPLKPQSDWDRFHNPMYGYPMGQPRDNEYYYPAWLTCTHCGYYYGEGNGCDCE